MYLTVCPLHGLGHDSSVGKWMYLTVCPLHGLGHDSSVGYLTVCPTCGQGYDSSVGRWMYLTVCPLHGPTSIPGQGGLLRGIFQSPLNGTTPPMDIEEEEDGRHPTIEKQQLIKEEIEQWCIVGAGQKEITPEFCSYSPLAQLIMVFYMDGICSVHMPSM